MLSRRRLLVLGVLGLAGGACGARGKTKELPIQLGARPRPTHTPLPTPRPTPEPDCAQPAAEIVSFSLEGAVSAAARTIVGQVKTTCKVAVDVTVFVRWLDGRDRLENPKAFVTLRRVQPGEQRAFKELAPGGQGGTRAELIAEADTSRRRR